MRPNPLRGAMAEGRTIVNGWLAIPSAYSAEVMGHQGYDSVTVDPQHGMIGFDAAVPILQALSSTPAVPLVRVSRNDYALVMQLLDAGAYGVICPMISTVAQAREFASFCRYPPSGQRSYGPARGMLYGGHDYPDRANDEILALAMIETRDAVESLDAILAVPGLDGIYVGPNDLCFAYGCRPSSEPEEEGIAGTIVSLAQRARNAGRMAGIFCSSGVAAARRAAEGFGMVTPGNDAGLLARAARDTIAAVRGAGSAPAAPGTAGGY